MWPANTPKRAMIADVAASILSRATTADAITAKSDQLQQGRALLGPFSKGVSMHIRFGWWAICGTRMII
jgi:hypothetical protein